MPGPPHALFRQALRPLPPGPAPTATAPPPPGLARPHHRSPPAFISGRTHHAARPGARPPAPVCVADAEPRCAPRPRFKALGGSSLPRPNHRSWVQRPPFVSTARSTGVEYEANSP
jgi:hypothetical protein